MAQAQQRRASRRRTSSRRQRRILTARKADKFVLYEQAVQSPDVDVRFLSRRFKQATGRSLRSFREDFCGTARLCCEFVKLHRENQAVGVDLDGPTLSWARHHSLADVTDDQRRRVELVRDDVRTVRPRKVDLVAAMNFSYSIFKTRSELLRYMKNVRRGLRPGGMFFMDAWGGAQSQELMEEKTPHDDFTYVWDQDEFDPITHHIVCKIHFTFRDGSKMRDAFVYDWRLWTLPELRELLEEAGFKDIHVLWELTDSETNEGNGVFRRVKKGDPDPAWVAYVVGGI